RKYESSGLKFPKVNIDHNFSFSIVGNRCILLEIQGASIAGNKETEIMTKRHTPHISKRDFLTAALAAAASARAVQAQPLAEGPESTAQGAVPRDWIDADTGHRIVRIS